MKLLAGMIAGLLLTSSALPAEVICFPPKPLKPVQCVCGIIKDQSGAPRANVEVSITIAGKTDWTSVKTGSDGEFSFDGLKAGTYRLDAVLDGFVSFDSPIVVVSPSRKCNRGMVLTLVLPYPDNCGSFVEKQNAKL
jgi:hypothetical protein